MNYTAKHQILDLFLQFYLLTLTKLLSFPLPPLNHRLLFKSPCKHPNLHHLNQNYRLYPQYLIFLQYRALLRLTFYARQLLIHVCLFRFFYFICPKFFPKLSDAIHTNCPSKRLDLLFLMPRFWLTLLLFLVFVYFELLMQFCAFFEFFCVLTIQESKTHPLNL